MAKSADAFRTISEVADWLDTPAHVLRFWESKFAQVKPVKRAGGRRYYRPQDMRLLGGIKKLLHDDGMTIKGVQKLLRDKGVKHVAALSAPLAGETDEDARIWAAEAVQTAEQPQPQPEPAQVLDFRRQDGAPEPEEDAPVDSTADSLAEPPAAPEADAKQGASAPEPEVEQSASADTSDTPTEAEEPPTDEAEVTTAKAPSSQSSQAEDEPIAAEPETTDETAKPEESTGPGSPAPAPRPAQIDVPPDPDDTELAHPGILSRIIALPRPLPAPVAEAARPLLARLDALRTATGDE